MPLLDHERDTATSPSAPDKTRSGGAAFFGIVSVSVFLVAIVFFLARIGSGALEREFYYWADNLTLPVFIKEFFSHSPLDAWRYPPNLYFFPDTLIYGILGCFLRNPHLCLVFFSAVQLVVYGLFLFYFVSRLTVSKISYFIFIILALIFVTVENKDFYYWQFFLLNYFHFGVVICFILSLCLIDSILFSAGARPAKSKYCLLFVLAWAAAFSDFLYIVQFVGPMVLLLLLASFFFPWLGRILAAAATLVGASACGVIAKELFVTYKNLSVSPQLFVPHAHFDALRRILSAFAQLYGHSPAVAALSLVSYCAALVYVFRLVRGHGKFSLFHPKVFFISFCLLSALANIAAGTLFLAHLFRYFLPMLFISPVVFILLLLDESEAVGFFAGKKIVLLGAALPILIVIAGGSVQFAGLANLADYYPEDVACIDKNAANLGLRYGLANYEQANFINVVSKKNLLVASVFTNMLPDHLMNSLHWYELPFDFALVDSSPYQLDVASKTSAYRVYDCGRTKLIVFDKKFEFAPFTLYERYKLKKGTYGQ